MLKKTNTGTKVNGFYRGIVKAHCNNGKCKIFWPGVTPTEFENDIDALPEAEQAAPLFCSSGTENHGVFFYPEIGTVVWGFFANEDVNYPVYFAATLGYSSNATTYNNDCYKVAASNSRDSKRIKVGNLTISFNTFANDIEITNGKSSITMTSDGNINITAGNVLTINSPEVNINANEVMRVVTKEKEEVIHNRSLTFAKQYNVFSTGGGISLVGDKKKVIVE